MEPPIASGPSLAGRAVLAVVLLIGFYALALGIAGGLLFLAYADAAYTKHANARLLIFCLIMALVILWSILPRRDRFEPPGPRLEPGRHPRLFDAIAHVARTLGQPMPAEVYLDPSVNAWVSQRGGVMGFGSRRVMAVGLPLMRVLSASQFRAVIGHEFGHYHGGDTKLGPWIYKTRGAIGRTITALTDSESLLRHPFIWYGNMFLRITHAISRRQELAADALAARAVGAAALSGGLKQVHIAGVAFSPYLENELNPVLEAGFRPPIVEGFSRFLHAKSVADSLDRFLSEEIKSGERDPYDTHPPLSERLAALQSLPPGEIPADDPPAISLLDALEELELSLLTGSTDLQPLSWEEVGLKVYVPRWQQVAAKFGDRFKGMTAGRIPELIPGALQLGRDVAGKPIDADAAKSIAQFVVGSAVSLALHKLGWELDVKPGETVRLKHDGREIEPFRAFAEMVEGKLAPDAWQERCRELGIADVELS